MGRFSWFMLICLTFCLTIGCENATQTSNVNSSKTVNTELPNDIKKKLADYELTKSKLISLEQEKEAYKYNYLTAGGDSTNPENLKTIKNLKDQVLDKDNKLSAKNEELLKKNNEIETLTLEIENLKTQLEEANKNSSAGGVDKVSIESKILQRIAEYAATKTRGDEIAAMINEFLNAHPTEKPNFEETLKKLANLSEVAPEYDAEAVTNFTEIATLSENTLTKCANVEDLAGIVYGLIVNQIKFAKSVDVALLIDTTSTMDEEIDKLKRLIGGMYTELIGICKDIRISIVTYRDLKTKFGDPGYVTQIETNFTRTIRDIILSIRKISVEKGGNYDVPEAVFEGMMTTLKDLSWSSRAEKRLMLLIGDAPAGTGDKFFRDKELGATHKVSLDDIKKQLETMKTAMITDETPVSIFPIVCAK